MSLIGEFIVRIGADTAALTKGLKDAVSDTEAFGEKMTSAGGTLTKFATGPILAIGAGLAASAVSVGSFADELLDLVDQTGLSAETLQEFRHVALAAGVETDTLAMSAIKLTTGLSGTGEESKALTGAIGQLGLSVRDSRGQLVPMDSLLPAIITKLQGMTDTTQRNALAGDIFGRSWAELAPVLSLGAKGLEDARQEARSLGLVMSGDALESADEFRREFDTLKASSGAVTRELGMAVLPILKELASFVGTTVVPIVRTGAQMFGSMSPEVQKVVLVVGALVAGVGPLLVVLGTASTLIPVVTAGFVALTGPIGLTVAAVTGAVAIWTIFGDDIKRISVETYNAVQGWIGAKLTAALNLVLAPIRAVKEAFFNLYDAVVGHSYVPDMVQGIATEFGRLPTVMVSPAASATTYVGDLFENMAARNIAAMQAQDAQIAQTRAEFLALGGSLEQVAVSSATMANGFSGSLGIVGQAMSAITGGKSISIGDAIGGFLDAGKGSGGLGGILGGIAKGVGGNLLGGLGLSLAGGPAGLAVGLGSKLLTPVIGSAVGKVGSFIGGLFGKKKKKATAPAAPVYAPPSYADTYASSPAMYDSGPDATAELRTHTALLQGSLSAIQEGFRQLVERVESQTVTLDEVRKQIRSSSSAPALSM